MPNKTNPIAFRDARLEPEIARRSAAGVSLGSTVNRDIARYYALLADELRSVPLSEGEAALICDALNGTLIEPTIVRLLWAEVDRAIQGDGLAEKWNVDGAALVSKLRGLTPGALFAVADGVERFWRQPDLPLAENLRSVGLVR